MQASKIFILIIPITSPESLDLKMSLIWFRAACLPASLVNFSPLMSQVWFQICLNKVGFGFGVLYRIDDCDTLKHYNYSNDFCCLMVSPLSPPRFPVSVTSNFFFLSRLYVFDE